MKTSAPTRKKGLARTGSLRRSGRKRRLTDEELLSAGEFHDAARKQIVCAECGRGGSYDAHHVIEKQELADRGLPLYDKRGALRLCDVVPGGCHQRHTYPNSDTSRVRLCKLKQVNIDYAFEVLGAFAYDYLKRRYRDEDPRVEAKLTEVSG